MNAKQSALRLSSLLTLLLLTTSCISAGIRDANDPIRNATVLFGNGCTGTLIREDMVLGCGHCPVLASWWGTPGVAQKLAKDWRALGDWQQQTVTITFNRRSPACVLADDPATCAFRTHVIASSEGGPVDQLLFLLDRPVPSTHATPSVVMSAAKFAAIGGIDGRSLRPAGWGLVRGGVEPRFRQTIPLNTAARLARFDVDPNALFVNMPAGSETQSGDSGSGLYWWDPIERRQYVLANLQSTGSQPRYFATFRDVDRRWNGADGLPSTSDDIPARAISTWIQGRLNDSRRDRFSPELPDRWLDRFCGGERTVCTTGDFDGDGDADVVRFNRDGLAIGLGMVQVGASRRWRSWRPGDRDSGFALTPWAWFFATAGESVAVGDLNSDGRDDIVRFERGGLSRVVVRTSLAVQSPTGYENPTSQAFSSDIVARSGDPVCQTDGTFCSFGQVVPGGGEDLVEIDGVTGNVRVLAANSLSHTIELAPSAGFDLPAACPAGSCRPAMGDFNGDGLDDLVFFPTSDSDIQWARNHGLGWEPTATLTTSSMCGTSLCRVGDVDGDGQADIVAFGADGEIRVRQQLRSETTRESTWHTGIFCLEAPSFASCEVADTNGDGLADIIGIGREGSGREPRGNVFVAISLAARDPWFINPRTGSP